MLHGKPCCDAHHRLMTDVCLCTSDCFSSAELAKFPLDVPITLKMLSDSVSVQVFRGADIKVELDVQERDFGKCL